LKRRQLADAARNRARQPILVQKPARIKTMRMSAVGNNGEDATTHKNCSNAKLPTSVGIVPVRLLSSKYLSDE
jgi:hypothetical protein